MLLFFHHYVCYLGRFQPSQLGISKMEVHYVSIIQVRLYVTWYLFNQPSMACQNRLVLTAWSHRDRLLPQVSRLPHLQFEASRVLKREKKAMGER
jgi:hypothetical protein